jgi:hypothetical protein
MGEEARSPVVRHVNYRVRHKSVNTPLSCLHVRIQQIKEHILFEHNTISLTGQGAVDEVRSNNNDKPFVG